MILTTQSAPVAPRQLYMVLSPHALPYARLALASLFAHSAEPLHLHLITDSDADKLALCEALLDLNPPPRHQYSVASEPELADAEASHFAGLPNLRAFRHGHPCWRKITDPLLLAAPRSELILLDPDLYFPNPFTFEPTPPRGLLLMWQKPNCLLPPEVVRTAIAAGIPLARHVDIGVGHWRSDADLEWVDWLLARLGGPTLPRMMHVEAIVWAAIAMRPENRQHGGYLDPAAWSCWHRSQSKRVRRKLGTPGPTLLAPEPWSSMKCFHAGGEAKWWLPDLQASSRLTSEAPHHAPTPIHPFVQLTPNYYEREQSAKLLLRTFGYYRLFNARAS